MMMASPFAGRRNADGKSRTISRPSIDCEAGFMLLERDIPLETLLATAGQAAAGNVGIVLIAGEAGIGKTSLLREFALRLDGSCRVLWGWCEALLTPSPLGPLQDMAMSLGQ